MRWIAALFLAVAVLASAFALVRTVVPSMTVQCAPNGCAIRADTADLLPAEARAAVLSTPGAQGTFADYAGRPAVRAGLAGLAWLDTLPFIVLTLTVGMALRRLTRGGGQDLAAALPWLRRASVAALAMALSGPLSDSLTAMLLLPGTPEGPSWYLAVDALPLALHLLLALGAFAVVRAVAAGSAAQRDVAEFV